MWSQGQLLCVCVCVSVCMCVCVHEEVVRMRLCQQAGLDPVQLRQEEPFQYIPSKNHNTHTHTYTHTQTHHATNLPALFHTLYEQISVHTGYNTPVGMCVSVCVCVNPPPSSRVLVSAFRDQRFLRAIIQNTPLPPSKPNQIKYTWKHSHRCVCVCVCDRGWQGRGGKGVWRGGWAHKHLLSYTKTNTCKLTLISHILSLSLTHTHACARAHTHTYAHTHTHIHTHTFTHTHWSRAGRQRIMVLWCSLAPMWNVRRPWIELSG